ncbi:MAG: NAD(P)-dependent oxidoreductase [Acidimicrobiales bacterium]
MSEPAAVPLGWIGTGRMGAAMAARLLRAGHELAVFNRTRAKTDGLVAEGAKAVDTAADLGSQEIVFITVASSDDLLAVLVGPSGLLTGEAVPKIVVDCSTVSAEASAEARAHADRRGAAFLAAPVSGNPKVVQAGRLTAAVSGPRDAFDAALPYLEVVGKGVTYVGEGDAARLVKLCHNLFLGMTIQALAEVTILAERSGVRRRDFLDFLNSSVMGSTFSRYKTPALVNLDFAPTFTTTLLRKDFDLGLQAARGLEVPMPVAGLVHQLVQAGVTNGMADVDFAALVELVARGAGMQLQGDDGPVGDGLGDG